jgi:hypothetical protein
MIKEELGVDLVYNSKKQPCPPIYCPVKHAYRPTPTSIAVELHDGRKVLVRATGGQVYDLVDEWKFVTEGVDGCYTYRCRSAGKDMNHIDKRKDNGGVFFRVASHRIEG